MDEKVIIKKQGGGFGSAITGFLIGGLIGASVALLSAPQSGHQTRQMLGNKANDLKDKANQMADQTKSKANQMMSNAKNQAADTIDKAKQQTSHVANRASDMFNEGAKKANQVGKSASSANNPMKS